jgi:hypothetical protein
VEADTVCADELANQPVIFDVSSLDGYLPSMYMMGLQHNEPIAENHQKIAV